MLSSLKDSITIEHFKRDFKIYLLEQALTSTQHFIDILVIGRRCGMLYNRLTSAVNDTAGLFSVIRVILSKHLQMHLDLITILLCTC